MGTQSLRKTSTTSPVRASPVRTSFVSSNSRSPVQTVYVSRAGGGFGGGGGGGSFGGGGGLSGGGRSFGGGLLSTSSPTQSQSGGCTCCWGLCTFCACGRIQVLSSATGMVKLGEVALGLITHLLLLNYGMEKEAQDLGIGLSLSLSTSSTGLATSFIMLLSYTLSAATYDRVRPSLFEVLFNTIVCAVYIAASSLLAMQVYMQLLYYYRVIPGFSIYPALTAAYVLGYAAGILHGIDALMALRFMRATRSTL